MNRIFFNFVVYIARKMLHNANVDYCRQLSQYKIIQNLRDQYDFNENSKEFY